MTNKEREIWREAFDLYDWNRELPNTEQAWAAFLNSLTAFAEKHDWKNCPLTYQLLYAVYKTVEDLVVAREREAREKAAPVQIFLWDGGDNVADF